MARIGMLLGSDQDLLIENGSIVVGNSDDQNVSAIVSASKGEFKEFPALGVGIVTKLKKQNASLESLKREITVNLAADRYKVNGFSVNSTSEFNVNFELL